MTGLVSAAVRDNVRGAVLLMLNELLTRSLARAEAQYFGIHAKGYWVVDMIRIDITGIPNSKGEHE